MHATTGFAPVPHWTRGLAAALIGLLASLALSNPVRAADPSSLFYTENTGAFWLASKDSYLYWYSPVCGVELLAPTVFIRVSPPSIPAYTVFNPPGCPSTTMFNNTRIAIDDAFIYWADGNNRIVQLSRSAMPPTAATIFGYYSAVPSDVVELAVDATFVYWLEGRASAGRVVRMPKVAGGGAPLAWTAGPSTNINRLRIDASGLAYVLSGGTLTRLVPDPSSLTFTTQPIGAQGLVTQYTLASDRIYWVESNASRQSLDVKSAPLSNTTQVTQHWTLTTTGNTSVQDMVVDGSNVYWIASQPGRTYSIMRLARAGGTPVVLASYGPNTFDQPWQLVAIGAYLFWSLPNKAQIRRLPITAPGLDLTTDGMGPMVVQVVQNPANDMPLIAGKPTVVQAFGRIDPATTAQTSILVNPSATLAGKRDDGSALPGSPLAPRSNFIELKSDPIDVRDVGTQTAFSKGLTFDLPESWTHGKVTLTATINPALTVPEINTANDTASSTVTFQDPKSYCLQFVPIQTETSTITGPSATIMSYIDRTISAYPLIEFQSGFTGGPGLRRPRLPFGFIQGSDPWKLDSDFEMGYLLWTMWWAYSFNTGYACLGEGTTVLGPVASAARYGMASPGVLQFLMQPGMNAVTTPYEGLAGIAHELGHEFGRAHIACPSSGPGAPANPDGGYPHPTCFTDANTASAHVGYDALSMQWMLPGSNADLMTYSAPLWISDYTYKAIANGLNLNTALSVRRPTGGNDGPQSLIGGLLGGEPLIGYAFPLDATQAEQVARRLEGRATASSQLQLQVRNVRGETLSRAPLRLLKIESEGGPEMSLFFNLVTLPVDAARLDVVSANGATVVSRAAGPGVPKVAITQPKAGAAIAESLTIAWTASDPDNDPLLSTVRYSPDNGKSWQTLAVNSNERTLNVPTSRLAGGRSALVEVTVSDGLHAERAIAGPFQIAGHAPLITIFDGSGRDLGPNAPAAVAQSKSLVLRGYGYDLEDGQIAASSLTWRLAGIGDATAGKEFRIADLAPGAYAVSLEASDSDSNRGRSQASVTVLPKHVGDAPEAIVLDGDCNDGAYMRDDDPLRLRFADGSAVDAHLVRSGNSLLVCFAGLPSPRVSGDVVGLWIHVDTQPSERLGDRDLGFFVRSDGSAFTSRGTTGGGWKIDTAPVGLAAAASATARGWSAELRIDPARLGGWNREVRVQAAAFSNALDAREGSGTAWPRGASATRPNTWGPMILGRVPQRIRFAALPDLHDTVAFELAATATSGLPVSYSVGGACTADGRHLTPRGAGACTVIASQAGNALYAPAASVTQSFLVCPSVGGSPKARQSVCDCRCGGRNAK